MSNLIVENTSKNLNRNWFKFEQYANIKFGSKHYGDLPSEIYKDYDIPTNDNGIDNVVFHLNSDSKFVIDKVIQCKYSENGNYYLSYRNLGTFELLSNMIQTKQNDKIEKILLMNDKVEINPQIENKGCFKVVKDNEFMNNQNMNLNMNLNENQNMNLNENLDINIIIPRDYQIKTLEELNQLKDLNIDEYLVRIPCGLGKSYIIETFIENHINNKHLILVPSIALAEQFEEYFKFKNININVYWTNNYIFNTNNNITLGVYNSIDKIIDDIMNITDLDSETESNDESENILNEEVRLINTYFDYIHIDECHHIFNDLIQINNQNSNSNQNINQNSNQNINQNSNQNINQNSIINSNSIVNSNQNDKNTYITTIQELTANISKIGYSATINSPNIYPITLEEAIKQNYLNDFIIEDYKLINIDDEDILFNIKCNMILNNEILRKGSKFIIYCNRIETAYKIQNILKLKFKLSVYTSEQSKNERKRIINDMKNNYIDGIISVNCLSEGLNITCLDTCIFFDDRQSPINIIQCIGRVLRKNNNKYETSRIIVFSKSNVRNEIPNNFKTYVLAIASEFQDIKHFIRHNLIIHDIIYSSNIEDKLSLIVDDSIINSKLVDKLNFKLASEEEFINALKIYIANDAVEDKKAIKINNSLPAYKIPSVNFIYQYSKENNLVINLGYKIYNVYSKFCKNSLESLVLKSNKSSSNSEIIELKNEIERLFNRKIEYTNKEDDYPDELIKYIETHEGFKPKRKLEIELNVMINNNIQTIKIDSGRKSEKYYHKYKHYKDFYISMFGEYENQLEYIDNLFNDLYNGDIKEKRKAKTAIQRRYKRGDNIKLLDRKLIIGDTYNLYFLDKIEEAQRNGIIFCFVKYDRLTDEETFNLITAFIDNNQDMKKVNEYINLLSQNKRININIINREYMIQLIARIAQCIDKKYVLKLLFEKYKDNKNVVIKYLIPSKFYEYNGKGMNKDYRIMLRSVICLIFYNKYKHLPSDDNDTELITLNEFEYSANSSYQIVKVFARELNENTINVINKYITMYNENIDKFKTYTQIFNERYDLVKNLKPKPISQAEQKRILEKQIEQQKQEIRANRNIKANAEEIDEILKMNYKRDKVIVKLFKYIIENHTQLIGLKTLPPNIIYDNSRISDKHKDIVCMVRINKNNKNDIKYINYCKILDYYGLKFDGINN